MKNNISNSIETSLQPSTTYYMNFISYNTYTNILEIRFSTDVILEQNIISIRQSLINYTQKNNNEKY
jgi:hypothetical protein